MLINIKPSSLQNVIREKVVMSVMINGRENMKPNNYDVIAIGFMLFCLMAVLFFF
jgi:hypothetical protein